MEWFEAVILGLIQGLTEFLPVSSSGHLAIGQALLGVDVGEDLVFDVVVHAATVLATIVVFFKPYSHCSGDFSVSVTTTRPTMCSRSASL